MTCLVRQVKKLIEGAEPSAEARFTGQGRTAYSLYEKSSLLKGCHIKKAKTAAHAHSTKEDSSDFVTFSNLKRFESDSLFQGFHNRVKYDFAKFVSNFLNSKISSHYLDNRVSFVFLVLYVISGFSVLDIEKGKTDEHENMS